MTRLFPPGGSCVEGGVKKIAIFDQFIALSLKRYKKLPVMLTRTFHQGPGPGQGLHSQGPGQGPGFEQMWSHQCEHSRHLN